MERYKISTPVSGMYFRCFRYVMVFIIWISSWNLSTSPLRTHARILHNRPSYRRKAVWELTRTRKTWSLEGDHRFPDQCPSSLSPTSIQLPFTSCGPLPDFKKCGSCQGRFTSSCESASAGAGWGRKGWLEGWVPVSDAGNARHSKPLVVHLLTKAEERDGLQRGQSPGNQNPSPRLALLLRDWSWPHAGLEELPLVFI